MNTKHWQICQKTGKIQGKIRLIVNFIIVNMQLNFYVVAVSGTHLESKMEK